MKDRTRVRVGKRIMAVMLSLAMVFGIFSGMKLDAEAREGKVYKFEELKKGMVLYEGDIIDISYCKGALWYLKKLGIRITDVKGETLFACDYDGDNRCKLRSYEKEGVSYNTFTCCEKNIKNVSTLGTIKVSLSVTTFEEENTETPAATESHTCSFQWVTTIDPTTGADGLEEYKCVYCGAVQESRPIPAATESHTCSFQWVTTIEPSVGLDGLEEYMCVGCGVVQESHPIPASVAAVKDFYGKVKDAPANGTVTYDSGRLYTISDYLLKKMSERNDVTLTVKFEYQNAKYELTFPAGTDYTPVLTDEETMYGYFGVAAKLGLTVVAK